ncbi:peptide deformylase, mitochondrial-like [Planococcus citri]|uniref:peptide deformylase, mitochondrial-like n=1 Tax=Planococcus citri TaxID=170843 RepID=UPI0031FA3AB0
MNVIKRIKKFMAVYRLPYEIKPPYTHIVQAGDPVLRKPAEYLKKQDIETPQVQELIELMKKITIDYQFVGLSACQIGIPLRIMTLHLPRAQIDRLFTPEQIQTKEIEEIPLQVWINPEMKVNDYKSVIDTEQCGSLLSLCADVKRYYKVTLNGLDENGKIKSLTAQGWTARIIQHEMDHLSGVLYTDIMIPKSLRNVVWKKINEFNGFIELRYYPKFQYKKKK